MSATDSFPPAGRDRRTSKGWVRTIAYGRRGVTAAEAATGG